VLVVVVGSDETVRRDKRGGRPILNEHLRVKMIDSLKPVDYVLTDYVISEDAHPLKLFDLLFEKLRPDAYVVNEDAFDLPYRRDLAKKHRVSLVVLPRTAPKEFEGISTTKIIDRLRNLKD
jgi:bifunctional ADP-heptose synthase (sugar kinase/adenylyltransferase)